MIQSRKKWKNMGRISQLNLLKTIFPPFTNRNVKLLVDKANQHIAAHLRQSKFYMIGARAQASFVNPRVDKEQALIYVDVEVGNEVVDAGVIHVGKCEGISRYPEIQITPEAILLGGTKKGTHAKIWLTPDSVYWHVARGCDYLGGFSKHDVVCLYDLLYIGIAKEQDSFQRLIKNAHHGRLKVLSEERARKPGAHPSDEIILFLFDLEPLSVQQFAAEDDDFDIFCGADQKKVVADAEKAFVKLLDPAYNVIKFQNYPKGDDGLYGEGLANYAYSLNENMRFMTANSMFKGAYSEAGLDNRQDFIMIEGDEVELHVGDELAPSLFSPVHP
ncbi:MAG: hypothetical protein HHJ17_11550 [Rhodoferax sp.]|nr:hypothetical protein [Rhodoferax sp.]